VRHDRARMAASSVAGTKRGGSSGASLARTQLRPRRGPYVSVRPARTFWPGAPGGHAGARTGADHDQPLPGTAPVEVWAIGHALLIGLQICQNIAPDILTPAVFERACELLAGLYPEG
jgi:hypothetical protein